MVVGFAHMFGKQGTWLTFRQRFAVTDPAEAFHHFYRAADRRAASLHRFRMASASSGDTILYF